MNARTSYSDQEKQIINDAVQQYPNNRRMAFDHAATHIQGRTAASISAFWYAQEKKKKTKRKYNKRGSNQVTIHSPHGEILQPPMRYQPQQMLPAPPKARRLPARQSNGTLSAFDVALTAIDAMTVDEMKALILHMMGRTR